jgi:multicomponent Na+:H+ antiporter subunit D
VVIPAPLFALFSPFVVAILGILSERVKIPKMRELGALLFSAVNVVMVYILNNMLQATADGVLVVFIGGAPPLGACLEIDALGIYMAFSAALLGFFATLYSVTYMEHDTRLTEYYTLLSVLTVSMIGVALAGDFFTLFVFWEMMGVTSYVLVAFRKESWGPIEAGFKYMVMGAVGSTILLLGMGLMYGMAGTLNFAQISSVMSGQPVNLWLLLLFVVFVIGFGIKSAIVPMHTWLPDAHPEAPSPISALLSGMLIETALYALSRVLFITFDPGVFRMSIAILAMITMSLANVLALLQTDIKRMLAYSSIAQIGYMLVGLSAGTVVGMQGLFLHVFNHSLMKGLAFLASGSLVHVAHTRDIDELKGVGRAMPLTSLALFVALLGLGGVPSTSGFVSKFILFNSAIGVGLWWLALLGVLNSAFSMAYYLRVMKNLVAEPSDRIKGLKEASLPMIAVTLTMALLIVLFGVWPQATADFAMKAAEALVVNIDTYVSAILG